MANTIQRDIYVLQDMTSVMQPIKYVKGTNIIPILLHIRDYTLPEDAMATAYIMGVSKEVKKQLCVIAEKTIVFIPSKTFFELGINNLQIRVTAENKDLITYKVKVVCKESIVYDDTQEIETQPTLVTQLLTKIGEISGNIDEISEEKATKKELAVERARIDNFVSLKEGSTTGDAELADLKVGDDGEIYPSAGTAVRQRMAVRNVKSSKFTEVPGVVLSMLQSVKQWLDEHPEATTTVQDASLGIDKMTNSARQTIVRVFDTVAQLKADKTLKVGEKCKTLGFYSENDGGASFYKITNNDNGIYCEELKNGLFAELIIENNTINSAQIGMVGTQDEKNLPHKDETELLDKLISLSSTHLINIEFNPAIYYVREINLCGHSYCSLTGKTHLLNNGIQVKFFNIGTPTNEKNAFLIADMKKGVCDYLSIKNIRLQESEDGTGTKCDYGMYIYQSIASTFENLRIERFRHGIYFGRIWNSTYKDLSCQNYRESGIIFTENINNFIGENFHCFVNDQTLTPKCNFDIRKFNALTLINPTSEGISPTHFKIGGGTGGLTFINPHVENGCNFFEVDNQFNSPRGNINVIGGLFTPNIEESNSINGKFVNCSTDNVSGLYGLSLDGISIRGNVDSKYLNESYFDLGYVLNFNENVTWIFDGGMGTTEVRFHNVGRSINEGFPTSRYGVSCAIGGGLQKIYSGLTTEYKFKGKDSPRSGSETFKLSPLKLYKENDKNRKTIIVDVVQDYNINASWEGATLCCRYYLMISQMGEVISEVISKPTSDNMFTLAFSIVDGCLYATTNKAYGNYYWNCEVHDILDTHVL